MNTRSRIILRIPGPWPTRVDIIEAVARSGTGYLFADDLLYNTRTLQTFTTLVGEYNPQMEGAFRMLSTGSIDEQTLSAIGKHTHSLYLVTHAESPNDARTAVRAADALLTAGGIAILVESSGIVHTASAWHSFLARSDSAALYEAFVSPWASPPNGPTIPVACTTWAGVMPSLPATFTPLMHFLSCRIS